MKWLYGLRARLRTVFRRDAEERMEEEIRFHIEMETAKNLRSGMNASEARRQAIVAFGGVERHREELRAGRSLAWVGSLSVDLKLGWRMLMGHRWMSLVAGLGIALAVATGTLFVGVRDAVLHSTLPFSQGERVVALEVRDAEANAPERRILHDFALWQEELRSVEDLGAWRPATRNLIVPGGTTGPVEAAEMSASGFRLARIPALLGRPLVPDDEVPEMAPVAVLSHTVWRTRFGGDPAVVGREIRLGDTPHTVVGVMPEGFAFPLNHELWVPLRLSRTPPEPRVGSEIFVFGRLAPGATLETAALELTTLGQRLAGDHPATHARLRPRPVPYTTQSLTPAVYIGFGLAQTLTILLLVLVCVNVAFLVHARTAGRSREIAVRTALGASRRRIVGQLFAESLVLALVSALVGVTIAGLVLEWAEGYMQEVGGLSFWMQLGISPTAVLYALALAAASAVIVGVLPALKVTGRHLRPGLDQSGGATELRLGRVWTAQIVGQVAIATAILPATSFSAWEQFRHGFARPDFPASAFLTARLQMEEEPRGLESAGVEASARTARFDDRVAELIARLEADPAVSHVTFAKYPVGGTVPATLAVDDLPRAADGARTGSVRINEVDLDLFASLDVPVEEGRGFRPSDLVVGATPVVVNQAFVRDVLGGRNAVGREFRYLWRYGWRGASTPGTEADTLRRYEIIGVVGDQLVVGTDPGEVAARVYHPTTAGRLGALSLAVRIRDQAPDSFAPRLGQLTAAVDPTLQLHDVLSMDASLRMEQRAYRFMGGSIAAVTLSVILLAAAGIHALMSFTITRRRREIGIRAALGARPGRLLAGVFARAAGQITVGLVLGLASAILLNGLFENLTGGQAVLFISTAATLMGVVGLLAALGPAGRALRVEPLEAMRAE